MSRVNATIIREPEGKQRQTGWALLRRTFPNLIGLLRIIPAPRWSAPILVTLGILASAAEALGIMLIPLFFYSMMNQLDQLASSSGSLGLALRFAMSHFHSSGQIASVFLLLIIFRGVLAYAYAIATAQISEQISQTTRDRVHSSTSACLIVLYFNVSSPNLWRHWAAKHGCLQRLIQA